MRKQPPPFMVSLRAFLPYIVYYICFLLSIFATRILSAFFLIKKGHPFGCPSRSHREDMAYHCDLFGKVLVAMLPLFFFLFGERVDLVKFFNICRVKLM